MKNFSRATVPLLREEVLDKIKNADMWSLKQILGKVKIAATQTAIGQHRDIKLRVHTVHTKLCKEYLGV